MRKTDDDFEKNNILKKKNNSRKLKTISDIQEQK